MSDSVEQALEAVDAEADGSAEEMEADAIVGAVGPTAAIGIGQVHAKLVYRAHLERVLRDAASLRALLEHMREVLVESHQAHDIVDEDCWYSCPKATYKDGSSAYCGEDPRDVCFCGADKWNAQRDALLTEIDAELRREG